MLTSPDGARATPSAALPFWAAPVAAPVFAAAYFLVHAVIAITLHSALGVDDAIENYHAQSLAMSYSPGNPPLYDWLLDGIQQVTGPGRVSFAILNYGALFSCVMLLRCVARRAMVDLRLQALSIYAYCLLWEIGHESHRILTHSNVMIVAIAATVLALLRLVEHRALGRYLALGFCVVFGLFSKFAFAAFLVAMLAAALGVPRFRSAILDRRITATLAVVALGVAILLRAASFSELWSLGEMLGQSTQPGLVPRAGVLLRSVFGYVIPLLPIALFIFFRRPAEREDPSDEKRDFRRFLTILLFVGLGLAVFWVMVLGSTQLRPRYFHAVLLSFPILLFARLDRFRWPPQPLQAFLCVCVAVSSAIVVEQALPRLAPSEAVFGACRLGIPYDRLGRELEGRFGRTPTLVGIDPARAGQLRSAVPGARVVTLSPARYRPPPRRATPCVLVWLDEGAGPAGVAAAAGIAPGMVETIEIPWFQPLLRGRRVSRFHVSVLPDSSILCQ